MSSNCPFHWRFSTTEAGLARGAIALYDIPVPTIAPYNDSSVESARGEGEQALHGFPFVDFAWDIVTRYQAFRIRKFVDDAKAATGWLYSTIDLTDDSVPGVYWVDVRGKPHRSVGAADEGPIIGRSRGDIGHMNNYTMRLNAVEIVNSPSIFTLA